MKTPPFLLIGCPICVVTLAVVYFLTFRHHDAPYHAALVAAETSPDSRGGHMGTILAQLDLTDAQHNQIDQVRQTVTDRAQRRQAILNVLTPEQRAKFQQLRAAPAGTP